MVDPNDVRCPACNKKLAEFLHGSAVFTCHKCHHRIYIDTVHNTREYLMTLTDKQKNARVAEPHPV